MTEASATGTRPGNTSRNPGDPGLPATLTETARAVRDRELSSVEVTTAALAAADRWAGYGIATAVLGEQALAAARAADDAIANGRSLGPLHGLPIGVKDIIFTRDAPTTGQSLVQRRHPGDDADAPVVARLRAAGAVIPAKTTTMEFAAGFPVPDSFPVPRNPWRATHWPGGSSSGSGNGVAVGAFLGALGTDTVGSVRIPAACCGITGLKPTYGRIPRTGVIPLAYSLDTVGPMARTAADCALLLSVLAGPDPGDPASLPGGAPETVLDGRLAGLRIGVARPAGFRAPGADDAAFAAVERAAAELRASGARLVEIDLPHVREVSTAVHAIVGGEATAFHHATLRDSPDKYGAFTYAALSSGTQYTAADYVQAQRVRAIGQAAIAAVFDTCDAVLLPTLGLGAPPLDGLEWALAPLFANYYTGYWNGLGLPTISVPCGFTADGLPLGLQLAGRAGDEATVLRIADAYQRRTDWHLRTPELPTAATVDAAAGPAGGGPAATEAGNQPADQAADQGGDANDETLTVPPGAVLHDLAEHTHAEPAVTFTARSGTPTTS